MIPCSSFREEVWKPTTDPLPFTMFTCFMRVTRNKVFFCSISIDGNKQLTQMITNELEITGSLLTSL